MKYLILFTLLLLTACGNAQTYIKDKLPVFDTIKVLLLISDTVSNNRNSWHESGYEVRYKYCCINGNTSDFSYYQPIPYYEHYTYLDSKKVPFKKSIVVWVSMPK